MASSGTPIVTPPAYSTQSKAVTQVVPWRTATIRKTQRSVQNAPAFGAAAVLDTQTLEGTGYLTNIALRAATTSAGNIAAVTYLADAPWNVFSNIVLKSVGADLVNISGYGLHLLNMYGGNGYRNYAASADTNVFNASVAVGPGNGGTFVAQLEIPLSINGRSLIGALGNQNNAVKFQLTSDVNPSTLIYGVAPTNPPTLQVNRLMDFATVPPPVNAMNQPQEVVPGWYGVQHYITQLRSESAPVASSQINHFLKDIGRTIRTIVLVFRDSTGARVDAALPTNITFYLGSDPWFSESAADRRVKMYNRYGFDAPAGVLVYDFISDFGPAAGFELGDDWMNTFNVPNAQIQCTYPAFANSPGTLDIITDSILIPQGMSLLGMV